MGLQSWVKKDWDGEGGKGDIGSRYNLEMGRFWG